MAVHAGENDIKLIRAIFEARYDEGFRYLDHCGANIVEIQRYSRLWEVAKADVGGTNLHHKEHNLTLAFNQRSMSVSNGEELDFIGGQRKVESMSTAIERLYEITIATLAVPNTTRVGARFVFTAPADSVEDADAFLVKSIQSNVLEKCTELLGATLVEIELKAVFEDDAGYRQTIRLLTTGKEAPGLPPLEGFPVEGLKGLVAIDVDTFTRPNDGHVENAGRFFTESYFKSQSRARELFGWLKQKQKVRQP